MARFYRRFIQNFAKIIAPLIRLTQKGEPYVWTLECNDTFEELKEKLTLGPELAIPDVLGDMVICTTVIQVEAWIVF